MKIKQKQLQQKNRTDEQKKKQLKQLIYQWLKQQQKRFQQKQDQIKTSNNNPKYIRIYSSSQPTPTLITQRISRLINLLYSFHPIFSRINYYLTQTLIHIGTFKLYSYGKQLQNIFYSQKNNIKYNNKIGIILYGKLKLYNKIEGYVNFIDYNDMIGEHNVQNVVKQQTTQYKYKDVKVKAIDKEETAILWIKKEHYQHLFKQAMKCGLREQIKKLQAHMRISWLKKKIKKLI